MLQRGAVHTVRVPLRVPLACALLLTCLGWTDRAHASCPASISVRSPAPDGPRFVGAALRFRLWEWAAPDGGNPQRHVPRIERCLYRERVGAPRAQRIDQRAEYGLGSSVVLGQVAAGRELLLQAHDRFLRVGERGRPRALTVPHAARIDQAFDDGAIVVTPTTPIRAEFVPFLSSGELDHSRAEVIEPNASGHRFTVCRSGTRLLWVVPRTTDGVNATLQVLDRATGTRSQLPLGLLGTWFARLTGCNTEYAVFDGASVDARWAPAVLHLATGQFTAAEITGSVLAVSADAVYFAQWISGTGVSAQSRLVRQPLTGGAPTPTGIEWTGELPPHQVVGPTLMLRTSRGWQRLALASAPP
jgi:hypothetical protein